MISPNHEPSEFEHPEDISRIEDLESRLRMLSLRDASDGFVMRMDSLFATRPASGSRMDETPNDRASLAGSSSSGNARRGFVLMATCLSSIIALVTFAAVTSWRAPDGSTSSVAYMDDDARTQNVTGDSVGNSTTSVSSIPRITKPSQSDSSITSLLVVGSQIVESERVFARSLAVAWEQQSGTTFRMAEHIRDMRFSECRRCHRRLSSAWHNEAAFQPEVSLCLNCHQVGG